MIRFDSADIVESRAKFKCRTRIRWEGISNPSIAKSVWSFCNTLKLNRELSCDSYMWEGEKSVYISITKLRFLREKVRETIFISYINKRRRIQSLFFFILLSFIILFIPSISIGIILPFPNGFSLFDNITLDISR